MCVSAELMCVLCSADFICVSAELVCVRLKPRVVVTIIISIIRHLGKVAHEN